MTIFRWIFVGAAALMLGLSFAVLTGSVLLAAVPTVGVLLVAAYVSWEARPPHGSPRAPRARREASGEAGYVAPYGGTPEGGVPPGGDCGIGGDAGGSFGGDGGGGGC